MSSSELYDPRFSYETFNQARQSNDIRVGHRACSFFPNQPSNFAGPDYFPCFTPKNILACISVFETMEQNLRDESVLLRALLCILIEHLKHLTEKFTQSITCSKLFVSSADLVSFMIMIIEDHRHYFNIVLR